MSLPLFYIQTAEISQGHFRLSEDTSRHVVSVLRMKEGEKLQLTDGAGNVYLAVLEQAHKKYATASVESVSHTPRTSRELTVAVSLLKNAARFEWFLEKATELGITRIVPLLCSRTEKQHYKEERSRSILISAMMQSGQSWLPELTDPQKFDVFIGQFQSSYRGSLFIGHCIDSEKRSLATELLTASHNRTVLVGPEGDFTSAEIALALSAGAIPVSLGDTRLRAETAALSAATLLALVNAQVPAL